MSPRNARAAVLRLWERAEAALCALSAIAWMASVAVASWVFALAVSCYLWSILS